MGHSLFPTSRMPMGMLQFIVFFYAFPGRNLSTHYSFCVLKSDSTNNIQICRSDALVITETGHKQCTYCLELSFARYSVDFCGVRILHLKVLHASSLINSDPLKVWFIYIINGNATLFLFRPML